VAGDGGPAGDPGELGEPGDPAGEDDDPEDAARTAWKVAAALWRRASCWLCWW